MKIIDLSESLYDQMPVYPGDPEVSIKEIHTLEKEGWRLRELHLTTHIGTHVNVPSHMAVDGKNVEDYYLGQFMGKAVIYTQGMRFEKEVGVIFRDQHIDQVIADTLIKYLPKFVGISIKNEFDIPIEKLLLEKGIISYEHLVNTEKLPDAFMFYGMPLNLRGADGSPVRAFAMVE